MPHDLTPPPRSPLDYAGPGIKPVGPPASDLEYAFGFFPAMGGALIAAWAWGCTAVAWFDPMHQEIFPF